MKICFLTHNVRQDNGAGVFSRRLIIGLRDAFNAGVIALTTVNAGEPHEWPILYTGKLHLLAALFDVRRLIKSCDVVHAIDVFPYGLIAALASLGLRKKLIITAIGSGSIQPLYRWGLAWLIRWVYRRAAAVTTISAFTRDEILKKVSDLSIAVINPGIDFEEFLSGESRIKNQGGRTAEKYAPYILSVGQLRWRKGYHLSIPAFAKVKRAFPDLHYAIVGKKYIAQKYVDVYYRRLQKLIQDLGLHDSVHILEDVHTREELIDVYRGAELFCLFSQNVGHDVEGFGQVFMEAAAAGLPVVGSKNCGVDDAVRDGENGILVPTRNPDDFADAIIAILRDPQKKKAMAAASLSFARSMGWDQRVMHYAELYRGLLH